MRGALLTDFSTEFTCLPHSLLIAKRNAFSNSDSKTDLAKPLQNIQKTILVIGNKK